MHVPSCKDISSLTTCFWHQDGTIKPQPSNAFHPTYLLVQEAVLLRYVTVGRKHCRNFCLIPTLYMAHWDMVLIQENWDWIWHVTFPDPWIQFRFKLNNFHHFCILIVASTLLSISLLHNTKINHCLSWHWEFWRLGPQVQKRKKKNMSGGGGWPHDYFEVTCHPGVRIRSAVLHYWCPKLQNTYQLYKSRICSSVCVHLCVRVCVPLLSIHMSLAYLSWYVHFYKSYGHGASLQKFLFFLISALLMNICK